MKVSVVIPAFNEEKYIGQCLKSLKNQEIPADEIIVIDNNSTDATSKIAKKLGVRVVKEKLQGMIPARNRGFNEAKYEIIARCDADTIIPQKWIKTIKEDFANQKIDGLAGPVYFYDSKFLKSTKTAPSEILQKSYKAVSKGNEYMTGPNMAITKKIWRSVKDKVSLDDSTVHEDIDLSINIASIGGIIGFDSKLFVGISARRIKNNPKSFFLEYPVRVAKTFWVNRGKLRSQSHNSRNSLFR